MTSPIPTHEANRGWIQRVGLARMQLAKTADSGTWLVDHAHQIGREKVVTVLCVWSLPGDGHSLRHPDVEVLAARGHC